MPEPSTEPLQCKCGNKFGKAYYVNNIFMGALIGSFFVDESMHGKCPQCGRGIHLVISRKAVLKLLNHYGGAESPFALEISE